MQGSLSQENVTLSGAFKSVMDLCGGKLDISPSLLFLFLSEGSVVTSHMQLSFHVVWGPMMKAGLYFISHIYHTALLFHWLKITLPVPKEKPELHTVQEVCTEACVFSSYSRYRKQSSNLIEC